MIGIIGEQRPAPRGGIQKLPGIGSAFAPFLIGGHDVMPTISEKPRHPQRDILIQVERRHLRGAIRGEARVNCRCVLAIVRDRRVHGLPRDGERSRHIIGIVER